MAATPSVVLDLLLRARTGDADAAGELLGKYRAYLKVLAARHLDSPLAARIDASDLVQQTCLSVVRKLPQFEGSDEAAFVAWLKTIHEHNIQTAIRDHLRTEKRAAGREVGLGENWHDDGLLAQARASSPSQRVMQGEQAARLAAALEDLPLDQREAVRLRYLEGHPVDEIARRLDRSPQAAAGLIKRGLIRLRKIMAE